MALPEWMCQWCDSEAVAHGFCNDCLDYFLQPDLDETRG